MALWKNTQHSFASGQLDTHVMGRQDLDRYYNGATTLKNFLVRRQGCISKRRGTDLTVDLKNIRGIGTDGEILTPQNMRLLPVVNDDDGRYIILTGGYAYTANRDGILVEQTDWTNSTAPTTLVRKRAVDPYGDVDPSIAPLDTFELIHPGEGNESETSWYSTFTEAADAAVDGDTIRLCKDYTLTGAAHINNDELVPSDDVESVFSIANNHYVMTRTDAEGNSVSYTAQDVRRFSNSSLAQTPDRAGYGQYPEQRFKLGTVTAKRIFNFSKSAKNPDRTYSIKFSQYDKQIFVVTADDDTSLTGIVYGSCYSAEVYNDTFTAEVDGETVTITSTWEFSDGLDWEYSYSSNTQPIFRYKKYDEEGNFVKNIYLGRKGTVTAYATNGTSSLGVPCEWTFDKIVIATYTQKNITFDLYGHTFTVHPTSYDCGLNLFCPNSGLTITSTLQGAKWDVYGYSNDGYSGNVNGVFAKLYGYDSEASNPNGTTGTGVSAYDPWGNKYRINHIILEGYITWTQWLDSSTTFDLSRVRLFQIKNGFFYVDTSHATGTYTAGFIVAEMSVDEVCIDNGLFDVSKSVGPTTLVSTLCKNVIINGGYFIYRPTSTIETSNQSTLLNINNYSSYSAKVTINGGYFDCDATRFLGDDTNYFVSRSESTEATWAARKLILNRGEFSFASCNGHEIKECLSDESEMNRVVPSTKDRYGFKPIGEEDYEAVLDSGPCEPFRVSVPYADEDLDTICARQSGDTVYLVHRNYPPACIKFADADTDEPTETFYYKELTFDNGEYTPPVITSAVIKGQDPVKAELPNEFTNPPSWITSTMTESKAKDNMSANIEYSYTKHNSDGTTKTVKCTTLAACLEGFCETCLGAKNTDGTYPMESDLGICTDAGFSGNSAQGSDSTYNYACSYTCTNVLKDRESGRKVTTVSVMSFTSTRAKENTYEYTNGTVTSCCSKNEDALAMAENDASSSAVMVMRKVKYVATYVKDGKESLPSEPVEVEYDMPWANNAVVELEIENGEGENDTPEYYNIYKDNGSGYGLIGVCTPYEVSEPETVIPASERKANIYATFPDATRYSLHTCLGAANKSGADAKSEFNTVVNLLTRSQNRWTQRDIYDRITSQSAEYPAKAQDDFCLITPNPITSGGALITRTTKAGYGTNCIEFDFTACGGMACSGIDMTLDGRYFGTYNGSRTYGIIYAQPIVKVVLNNDTANPLTQTVAMPDIFKQSVKGGKDDWMVYLKNEKVQATKTGAKDTPAKAKKKISMFPFKAKDADDQLEMTNILNRNLRTASFTFTERKVTNVKIYFERVESDSADYIYDTQVVPTQGAIHRIHFTYSDKSTSTEDQIIPGRTYMEATFSDDYINPDMTVTPPKKPDEAHFAASGDYPGTVGFHDQRLIFASSNNDRSTIWMSRIADLYSFTPHESIREDDALELTLAMTEFPKLNHLVDGRSLMLLGDGGEWIISPLTGNALTYKTAQAKLQSSIGSDQKIQPLPLSDETLFAERGGQALRSINYNYSSDSYQSQDLSVIAQSIFNANPIVSMAYKQHPDSIVECVLSDGKIATLVYMKEQDVLAWSVQELGGGWKAKQIVTPRCIVDGTTEMMILVKKGTTYQLWKVRNDSNEMTAEEQVILDGMHIESRSTATGDETVVFLRDGRYAHGYPITSEFVSVRPEPKSGATAQMEIKNATEGEIRVIHATTFEVKPYNISMGWRKVVLEPTVANDGALTLQEKDCKRLMTGTNNRDGRFHLRHTETWPITILSVSTTYQVEYENQSSSSGGGQ